MSGPGEGGLRGALMDVAESTVADDPPCPAAADDSEEVGPGLGPDAGLGGGMVADARSCLILSAAVLLSTPE